MTRRRGAGPIGWLLGMLLVALLAACGGAAAVPTPVNLVTPTISPAASAAPAGQATAVPAATATRAATAGASAPPAVGTATRAAAGSPVATPHVTSYPLTVKDDMGRTVTLAKKPLRIVSLAPSNTEILFAVGLGDRVVGVDKFSNYPPAAQSKPKITEYTSTNLEQVLAAAPDLILATSVVKADVIAAFEGRGIPTIVLNPSNVDGVLENISLVGQLADANADAATLRGGLEARLATIATQLKGATTKPRVFFELEATQFFTVGPKSFIDDQITRAGGANIAADTGTPYPKLSPEQIIARDPEVIILSDEGLGATIESVKQRPGWSVISAVKTGRILGIDPDVASRPGPRVIDSLEQMVRAIHPELFR